jgi:hypothetical protein
MGAIISRCKFSHACILIKIGILPISIDSALNVRWCKVTVTKYIVRNEPNCQLGTIKMINSGMRLLDVPWPKCSRLSMM